MLGELEHLAVAVGVAGGEQGPAAGAAPDPDRLLGPVVEVVGLRLVRDRAAIAVAEILQRRRTTDHPLPRNAVDLLGDRAHEVTAPPEAM
jgi:hypothetical protein